MDSLLALLKELLPAVSKIAVLWHPGAFSEQTTSGMLKQVSDMAGGLGLRLQLIEVRSSEEFERAFANMAKERVDALFPLPSPMLYQGRKRLVDLAAQYRLPAVYNAREFVDVGGLTQSNFVNPNLCPTCIITTSSSPRVGIGVGISWHTQFGLLNVDLTPFVVKQPKDQTQVFRFGFGTRF